MKNYAPELNNAYLEYVQHLLQYHSANLREDKDTPAAEELEEKMIALWGGMDDVQRKSLGGIGSDLIWIRSKAALPPRGRRLEEITEFDEYMLREATKSNDFHAILHHLRVCAAAISPENLALTRAESYRRAGLPELGAIFFDFADALGAKGNRVLVV